MAPKHLKVFNKIGEGENPLLHSHLSKFSLAYFLLLPEWFLFKIRVHCKLIGRRQIANSFLTEVTWNSRII